MYCLEAIRPLRIWQNGRSMRLQPGQRIVLSARKAEQLIAMAAGSVKVVSQQYDDKMDWEATLRELGTLFRGLGPEDPRLDHFEAGLALCNERYERLDWHGFHDEADRLTQLARLTTGMQVWWNGSDGTVRGPAVLEGLVSGGTRMWVLLRVGSSCTWIVEGLVQRTEAPREGA